MMTYGSAIVDDGTTDSQRVAMSTFKLIGTRIGFR
jgi:hypothetical protein